MVHTIDVLTIYQNFEEKNTECFTEFQVLTPLLAGIQDKQWHDAQRSLLKQHMHRYTVNYIKLL